MLDSPPQGQQNRGEHFWAVVSTVTAHGWRENRAVIGPIHGAQTNRDHGTKSAFQSGSRHPVQPSQQS